MGRLDRDADDRVVVCRTQPQAGEAREIIGRLLERLQLTRHPDQTRVVGMADEGCDFLGVHVHKTPSQRTRRLVP